MIISKTPVRISFFGGGTDYPLWYREHGGQVLATAINKYTYISLRYLPPFFDHKYRLVYSKIENIRQFDEIQHPSVREVFKYLQCNDGLELHHDGDLPARSGLGSSSSFTVGLLNAIYALRGQYKSYTELALEAIHVEQNLIKEAVGSQDQITCAFGGLNRVRFHTDDTFTVEPVLISPTRIKALQKHMLLFFTGISRFAVKVAQSKMANFEKKADQIHEMGAMVDESLEILASTAPILDFGKLLHESWQRKRQLSEQVSSSHIDEIYDEGLAAGAVGGKILGAGGGGFILFFVPPEQQDEVKRRLHKLVHVPFTFEKSGSRIVLYQPDGL